MPNNLFYTVQIPCSIWIINRNKKQKDKTLFINASNLGTMVTRRLRELDEKDIKKVYNQVIARFELNLLKLINQLNPVNTRE